MKAIEVAEGRVEVQIKYKGILYGLGLRLEDFPKKKDLDKGMRELSSILVNTLEMKHLFAETFLMDSWEHKIGDPDCCGSHGEICLAKTNQVTFGKDMGAFDICKGILHYQPVYGGYYYECDKCGRTK